MSRRVMTFVFLALLLGASPCRGIEEKDVPPGRVLDLESCLLVVLGKNPSIEADRFKAQALREDARVVVANQKTNVSLSGSFERWTYYPDSRSDQTLSLVLRQNVDVSGLYRETERKALFAYRQALHDYAATINSVLSEAEQTYWKAFFARRKAVLLESVLEERRQALDLLELQLSQQLVTKIDVTKGRVNLEEGLLALEEARASEIQALEELAWYAGGERLVPLQERPDPVPSLPGSLEEALGNNPKLASARTGVDYSRTLLVLAAKGRAPTVQLQATYRLWTDYTYPYSDVEANEWDLLLYIDIPLVDGGKEKADVRKNILLVEESLHRLRAADDEIRLRYRQACEEWASATRKVEVLERQQRHTDENQSDIWTLFQERMKDTLALMDAFEKDQQAKTQLVEARLDVCLAEAKAREALGSYLERVPRNRLEGGIP